MSLCIQSVMMMLGLLEVLEVLRFYNFCEHVTSVRSLGVYFICKRPNHMLPVSYIITKQLFTYGKEPTSNSSNASKVFESAQ